MTTYYGKFADIITLPNGTTITQHHDHRPPWYHANLEEAAYAVQTRYGVGVKLPAPYTVDANHTFWCKHAYVGWEVAA